MAATTVNLSAISARLPRQFANPVGRVWLTGLRLDAWPRCATSLCFAAERPPTPPPCMRNVAARLRLAPTAAPRRQPSADSARHRWPVTDRWPPAGLSPSPANRHRFVCARRYSCELASILSIHHQPTERVGTSCASAPGPIGSLWAAALTALVLAAQSGAAIPQATELRKRRWQQCQTGPCDNPGERMDTARESRKSGSTWSRPCMTTF